MGMENARHPTVVRIQRRVCAIMRGLCLATFAALLLARLAHPGVGPDGLHWASARAWSVMSNAPESPTAHGFGAPEECMPFALPCDAHILCISVEDIMAATCGSTLDLPEAPTGENDHAR